MKLRLANNAETLLAGALSEVSTTVLLTPGTGQRFPALAAGEFFPLTLIKTSGGEAVREIVYVTARNVDSCTVLRAQEGTQASSFASGDYVGCHPTAGCFALLLQKEGGIITGPVDMSDQIVSQAIFKDCAEAYNDNAAVNTMDIKNGKAQRWAPNTGAQALTLTGWPPSGTHGEILLYGVNVGAATATITGSPINWRNDNGSFTVSNSINSNHGRALQTNGMDFIYIWSPDSGVTRYGRCS